MYGRLLLFVLVVHIRTLLDEEPYCLDFASSDGVVERSLFIAVDHVGVCPSFEQQLAHFHVAFSSCIENACLVIRIYMIGV